MLMEHWIMIAMWVFGLAGFFRFIPREEWRKGFLAFLMFQAIIWLGDMITFALDWQRSPVRLLPKATDMPLTLDYFFYPVLFAIYYVNRKSKGGLWSRFIYFFVWTSIHTLYDNVIERYTDIVEYKTLTWYLFWLNIGFYYYVSEVCCNWFFKDKALFQTERKWGTNEN